MTTSEMLEQIEIELFGFNKKPSRHVENICLEQELLADQAEYERSLLNNRNGIKADRIA
jgi:hypothetical protein